jgi:hypothetical protein
VPSADVGMPPPAIDAYEVQGYCLSTRWDHLPGRYVATFESDGKAAYFDLSIHPTSEGTLAAVMGTCAGCAELGIPEQQTQPLDEPNDALGLAFAVDASGASGHARLHGRKSAFVGEVKDAAGGFAGTLRLERTAP